MPEPVILVPLDGTSAARAALPIARTLAQLMAASLRVIHVSMGPPSPLSSLAERLGLGGTALDTWSIGARTGEPAVEILEEARTREACLLAMCTHTATVRPHGALGRTARGVLRDAPCPVVLTSPVLAVEVWWPRRILLAYDGSPSANAAVAPAAALARCAGAELLVVQVGASHAAPTDRGSLTMPLYVDQPHHEWPNWTGELLERLACLCHGEALRARLHVRGGEPGPEIVRFAREQSADLIVLAWKGDWGDGHAGTLKTVLRDAPCPLMIVRTPVLPD